MTLKSTGRVLKRLGLGGLALVTLALIALLAVNRNDRPPSPAAQQMLALYQQRTPVPLDENGYVFAMGFDAAQDEDPRHVGADRIAWYNERLAKPGAELLDEPARNVYDPDAHRSDAIQKLLELCKSPQRPCADALTAHEQAVALYVGNEAWRLTRYRALLANRQWELTMTPGLRMAFPPYGSVLDAQKLLFLKVWLLAGKGDVRQIKALLSADISFWRTALASSDVLIDKLIASVALDRHFAFAQLVLRRLPGEQSILAVPAAWYEPFSRDELSMKRVFAGEWMFVESFIQGMARDPDEFPILGDAFVERTVGERMIDRLASHLLQPQDALNQQAEFLLRLAAAMDVPLESVPQALLKVSAMEGEMAGLPLKPYNPTGTYLVAKDSRNYTQYAIRVMDLEGVRRAALLTAQIRSQGVKYNEVGKRLADCVLRNPYDATSFGWNARAGTVEYVGLASGERGHHALLY